MTTPVDKPVPHEPTKRPTRRQPKSDKLKKQAQAAINPTAKPVPLSNLFSGFTPDLRGNVEIELDTDIPERFVAQAESVIRNLPNINFILNGEADSSLAYMREMLSGLNLSVALKLIHATPQSGISEIADLHILSDMSVRIPTNFIQVVNLIGKTDYYDSVLRVRDNSFTIRLHLLKAIWLALKTQSFMAHPGNFVDWSDNMSRLLQLTASDLKAIVFDDYSTVAALKRRARERLDSILKETTTVRDNDKLFTVSPAYLDPKATKAQFIQWLETIPPGFTTSQVTMGTVGICTIFDRRWLKHLDTELANLDASFTTTPLSDITPREILEELDTRFIGQYFPQPSNFVQTTLDVIAWFSNESVALGTLLDYTDMSKTTFGHAAQLTYLDRNDLSTHRSYYTVLSTTSDEATPDGFLSVQVPKRDATMIYSAKKLTAPGEILTAASSAITRNVHLREKFKGFTTQPLTTIASTLARKAFRGMKQ
jgi:hypothetical protein